MRFCGAFPGIAGVSGGLRAGVSDASPVSGQKRREDLIFIGRKSKTAALLFIFEERPTHPLHPRPISHNDPDDPLSRQKNPRLDTEMGVHIGNFFCGPAGRLLRPRESAPRVTQCLLFRKIALLGSKNKGIFRLAKEKHKKLHRREQGPLARHPPILLHGL
jgi:hypothetical protein